MAEDVETGGLMKFRYERGREPKLSEEKKRELEDAYRRAGERKRREKRNKIIIWIIAVMIALLALFLIFYFK